VRVEVLGVAPVTYTTEAALVLADKATSFGDNKLASALRAAVEEACSRMACQLTQRWPVARFSSRRAGGGPARERASWGFCGDRAKIAASPGGNSPCNVIRGTLSGAGRWLCSWAGPWRGWPLPAAREFS
jgi:hypothetical protein